MPYFRGYAVRIAAPHNSWQVSFDGLDVTELSYRRHQFAFIAGHIWTRNNRTHGDGKRCWNKCVNIVANTKLRLKSRWLWRRDMLRNELHNNHDHCHSYTTSRDRNRRNLPSADLSLYVLIRTNLVENALRWIAKSTYSWDDIVPIGR